MACVYYFHYYFYCLAHLLQASLTSTSTTTTTTTTTTLIFTALHICCRHLFFDCYYYHSLPCEFAAGINALVTACSNIHTVYNTSMMASSSAAASTACQVYQECKKDHAKTCPISLMHLNQTTASSKIVAIILSIATSNQNAIKLRLVESKPTAATLTFTPTTTFTPATPTTSPLLLHHYFTPLPLLLLSLPLLLQQSLLLPLQLELSQYAIPGLIREVVAYVFVSVSSQIC